MKKAKKLGNTLLGILLAGVVCLVGIILYAEYSGHRFQYDGKDNVSEVSFPDEASRLIYDENGNIAELPGITQDSDSAENPGETGTAEAVQTEDDSAVNPAAEDGDALGTDAPSSESADTPDAAATASSGDGSEHTFIMDTGASLFHYDTCPDVQAITEGNRLSMTGTRDQVAERGYEPCPVCNP